MTTSPRRKQRHPAANLHRRLRDEQGYLGGYDQVRRYVAKHRRDRRETFIPLTYPPDRVFQAWIDGLGFSEDEFFPSGNAGNGTGAIVGIAALVLFVREDSASSGDDLYISRSITRRCRWWTTVRIRPVSIPAAGNTTLI